MLLRFKYTTKFSLPKIACPAIVYAEIVVVIDPFLPKIACPAIVYAEIVVVIDPFFVGVCP